MHHTQVAVSYWFSLFPEKHVADEFLYHDWSGCKYNISKVVNYSNLKI